MPKRKIETASEAERELSSTSNSKRGPRGVSANNNDQQQQQQQQQHDTDNYNQAPPSPPTKRLRAPLNFSIESLMQPSQQQLIAQNQALNVSRSPSPAGSDAGSSASGASTNTLASDQAPYLSQQQQQHLMSNGMRDTLESLASSSSSSRSSSRVSSPISPGCNPAITSTISNTTTSVAGLAKQHEKMAPTPPSNGSLHNLASRASIQPSNGQHSHQNHNQATAIQQQQAGPSATSGPNTTTTTSSSKGSKGHRSGGHSSNSRIKPVCTDSRLAPFECHLDNLELWHRFHPLDTEMIITKQGRRMFPPVRVTFSFNEQLLHQQQAANRNQLQFNSRDRYQVLMDILPYDNKRYRYAYHKSSWQQAGKADPPSPTKLFLHPDGPFTLDQLKRQVISFEKIKLTNNDANKHGYIVLNSMHKYQPRIHLILWRGKESQSLANGPINLLDQEAHKTFIFSETIFTAVTAYQNHSITKLKIDSNPFAKGFRDSTRLTDLELESMQDLIADGQCPFSPPRAPPPGFPHFLFAAAQHPQFGNGHLHHQLGQQTFAGGQPQQQHLGPAGSTTGPTKQQENATAALLRERTIMALDSFLQQQQQHHHHQQQHQPAPNSESPTAGGPKVQQTPTSEQQAGAQRPACHSPSSPQMPPNSTPFSPAHFASFLNAAGGPPPPSYQQLISLNHQHHNNNNQGQPIVSMAPAGQSQNQAGQLEQFILQQQQQFAAAMAAAATGVHQHPAYLQSLFAQAAAAQQQQQCQAPPPVGSTTPTGCAAAKLISSSSSPPGRQQMPPATTVVTSQALQQQQQQQHHHHHHLEQTSPIGMAKSANRMQLQDLNQFLSAGGPTGNSHSHPLQVPVTSSAAGNQQQQQQQQFHLQALMQQHHQQMQQMAALAQQHQKHHQPSCLQVEPQLITQSHELEASGPVSRKASTKTTSQK